MWALNDEKALEVPSSAGEKADLGLTNIVDALSKSGLQNALKFWVGGI